MTAKFIANNSMPTYLALSSDITSGSIAGCVLVGRTVYLTDTSNWMVIKDDLTLAPFSINSNITVSASDIEIGAVELKDGASDTRVSVNSGSSIVSRDNAVAVHDANPIPAGTNSIGNVTLNSGSSTVGTVLISGSIANGASESHIGQIGGTGYVVSASFTGNGTATLHAVNSAITPAAGGLVAIPNAIRVNGGSAYIMDVSLTTSNSSIVIVPKIHFSSSSSITVAPDSGSWVDLFADDPFKLGVYTLPAMAKASGSSTDCSRATSTDTSITSHPAILAQAQVNSTNIYVGIETTTAFTCSASQVWNIKLRMDQN
jgi:hypothetical protein